jgi:hypothetical protein
MGGAWSWNEGTGRVGERGEAYCVFVGDVGAWPFSAAEYASTGVAAAKGDLGGYDEKPAKPGVLGADWRRSWAR